MNKQQMHFPKICNSIYTFMLIHFCWTSTTKIFRIWMSKCW